MQQKKTLVLGASLRSHRYSYRAVLRLIDHNIPVVAVGLREGTIEGVKIEKPFFFFREIHTITLYVGPLKQKIYKDYIMNLHPTRVIFNPGTENPDFEQVLRSSGVEVVENCMFVMLSGGLF